MSAYFSGDLLEKFLTMYGVNMVYRQVSFYAISLAQFCFNATWEFTPLFEFTQ